MGRGQDFFKSPHGSKLKRDLLFHDNIWYANNISKNTSFTIVRILILSCYVFRNKILNFYLYEICESLNREIFCSRVRTAG